MTQINDSLYQPSLSKLAKDGDIQALTDWMNSLLAPHGIRVQVKPASARYYLKIFVNFQPPARKNRYVKLRDQLVRFICYRLWTLNSDTIWGVQIIARVAGESKVLWQQSVRLNTPANSDRLRRMQMQRTAQQSNFGLQFLRAIILSSTTFAGVYIGYRLFYFVLSILQAG